MTFAFNFYLFVVNYRIYEIKLPLTFEIYLVNGMNKQIKATDQPANKQLMLKNGPVLAVITIEILQNYFCFNSEFFPGKFLLAHLATENKAVNDGHLHT